MNRYAWSFVVACMAMGGLYKVYHDKNPNLIKKTPPAPQISYSHSLPYLNAHLDQWIPTVAPDLHPDVLEKIKLSLECDPNTMKAPHRVLTVIDYSLPSNQKRLWVFDLNQHQLLFHTYVAHGLRSGAKFTTFFSNAHNSRASSMGVYRTLKNYLGREGSSLRLKGLEPGFNDNAEGRAIVMHGAFYAEEYFIKKYGRAGRSWGCPALPASQTKNIIDVIKDDNLMVVYYPSEHWLKRSKYLTCKNFSPSAHDIQLKDPALPKTHQVKHEEVLFLSHTGKNYGAETPPILAVSAEYYRQHINQKVPLNRMLRRQIAHQEYIALSKHEVINLANNYHPEDLSALKFIIPTLKMNHGYVQTVMKPLNFGEVTGIIAHSGLAVVTKTHGPIYLQPNAQFIRWLGL